MKTLLLFYLGSKEQYKASPMQVNFIALESINTGRTQIRRMTMIHISPLLNNSLSIGFSLILKNNGSGGNSSNIGRMESSSFSQKIATNVDYYLIQATNQQTVFSY